MIFSGSNTGNEFCKWLISEQHRNVTAIAHNSRAYDAYFIYDYLMRNSIVPEPSIFSGSKIMFMKVGRGLQGPSTARNSVEVFIVFVCIKLLGNVVRVYPKIVQGLTFLSV